MVNSRVHNVGDGLISYKVRLWIVRCKGSGQWNYALKGQNEVRYNTSGPQLTAHLINPASPGTECYVPEEVF